MACNSTQIQESSVSAKLLSSCKNPEMSPISLIQLLQAGGLVSGSILSVLGLALLYKGMSRKEAKEHL